MSTQLPPIRLRPLTVADANTLQAVYNGAADYFLKLLGRRPNFGEATRDLQAALMETNRYIMGIEYDGEMVGMLDVRLHYPEVNITQIGLLLLTQSWRNRGVGTWALRMFESWLRRDTSIRQVRLNVAASNREAQRFWQREGYQFSGETTRIELSTHTPRLLVMIKTLSELS